MYIRLTIHDPDTGTIIGAGQAFGVLLDEDRSDIIGAHLDDLLPDGPSFTREQTERFMQQVVEKGSQTFQGKDQTADGETITGQAYLEKATINDQKRVLAVIQECQTCKKCRKELRRYKRIFQSAGDGIFTLNADGEFMMVNEKIVEDTGYDRDELLGSHISQMFDEAAVEDIERRLREVLGEDAGDIVHQEGHIETAGGDMTAVEFRIAPVLDGDDLQTTVGIVRDISAQKQREREVKKQTDKLNEFASIVSHDLRNPLNVAQGRLELAMDDCESDHLREVRDAHQRMNTLINDLLTLARNGNSLSGTESVSLRAICDQCWQFVASEDAQLTIDTDRIIEADPSRLKQLLENLFRNAVEHSNDDVEIIVGELHGGFYVEDNGPGIPPGEHERIFERGFTTGSAGTGLGLAIVERVVRAHGWNIHATDGNNGGARFEITGIEFVD